MSFDVVKRQSVEFIEWRKWNKEKSIIQLPVSKCNSMSFYYLGCNEFTTSNGIFARIIKNR